MRNVPAVTTRTPACSPGAGARCQKNAPLLAEGEVFFLDIPVHRTPFWPAFSRPKFFGVAPARHGYTVTVFCPRAYTDVSEPESREETIPINERRESRWQYGKHHPNNPKPRTYNYGSTTKKRRTLRNIHSSS